MNETQSVFEQAMEAHAASVGLSHAVARVQSAGIQVSETGQVIDLGQDPAITLLKLVRLIAEDGGFGAMQTCLPLIKEVERLINADEPALVK